MESSDLHRLPIHFGLPPYRLNLGCGFDRRDGYINVDQEPTASCDLAFNLEREWPLPDGCASEILARHVVEHIQDLKHFFRIAYRVMRPGAKMVITVPHHCSDFFWGDPTHVRPITELMLMLLSQKACREYREKGYSNTPLAVYWGVDFETDDMALTLDDMWKDRLRTTEEVTRAMRMYNNVVSEVTFTMRRV